MAVFGLATDKVQGEEQSFLPLVIHVLRAAGEALGYHLRLLVDRHGTDVRGERGRGWREWREREGRGRGREEMRRREREGQERKGERKGRDRGTTGGAL